MFYRFASQVQHEIVKYLGKVLKRQTKWENVDFKEVELIFGSTTRTHVFENFYREREEYPVVVTTVGPATTDVLSLSDYISTVIDEQTLGTESDDYGTIGGEDDTMWAVKFTTEYMRNLYSATFTLANAGGLQGDILVSLVSGSGSLPGSTAEASGSIKGFTTVVPGKRRVDFDSICGLESSFTGWLTLQSDTTSPYRVYFGSGSGSSVAYKNSGGSWTLDNTKLPTGDIQGRTYQRLGGGVESNLIIEVASKDENSTKDLADIVAMYLLLSRQTELKRDGTDETSALHTGWLAKKGMYLSDVSFGGVVIRKRGDENIFAIALTARCWGHWHQDYAADTLKEIEVDITHY